MSTMKRMRPSLKMGLLAPMALTCLAIAPHARADSILLAQTTLVSGTEYTVDAFTAPSAGKVTVNLQNLNWPTALNALSFSMTSASQVLSPESDPTAFDVGAGTYFAHIMATAGGDLNLGLWSLMVTFNPTASPVPLPASDWMLLTGMFVLAGLARAVRPMELTGIAEA